MKLPHRMSFAAIILSIICLAAQGAERQTVKREFKESDDLVLNADCGWVAYNYEDSYAARKRIAGDKEPFALASVIYTRHPMSAWETEDGSFENTAPLNLLEDWMQNGRNIAFRVYANTVNDLPAHLRESVDIIDRFETKVNVDRIAYWDTHYLEHHRKLITFLGERFATSPQLAYVDIGGVGDTGGEWFFDNRRAYDRTGLTDEVFFDMLKSFVEMYREAFPQTRLFISYDAIVQAKSKRKEAMALLLENDIGVRDDGLGGWPWPREYASPKSWPMPEFWPDVPVLFEGSGKGGGVYGWKEQRKDPVRILRWAMRKGHPSYINIAGAETKSEKACIELRDLLLRYGTKLGYRFVLLEATYPSSLKSGTTAIMETHWANRGVSRCYAERNFEIVFCNEEGPPAMTFCVPANPATTTWAPESDVKVNITFPIPETAKSGTYDLRIGMLMGNPNAPEQLLKTATAGADNHGYIMIGKIRIEP